MSLASIKRRCTLGTSVKMVRHDRYSNSKVVGSVRRIALVQTNAIAFATTDSDEPCDFSWLHWPKASAVRMTENGFEVRLGETGDLSDGATERMGYQFCS